MDEHRVVMISEAARALNISRTFLWRRIRNGEIAAFASERDRRKCLIRVADLEAYRPGQPLQRKEIASAA